MSPFAPRKGVFQTFFRGAKDDNERASSRRAFAERKTTIRLRRARNTPKECNRMSQTKTTDQPDVSQLRVADLPTTPFPGGQNQSFRIFFTPEVHARIWQHARESLAVEICGVLVGSLGQDPAGPFVVISEAIRGEAATSKFAEVTFTHETWNKINQEMDTKY